jgi:membrane associated rhomboid family serine protease
VEIVRVAPDRRTAEEWVLVLVAEGIEGGLLWVDGGIAVVAPAEDVERSRPLLEAFEGEQRAAREDAAVPEPAEWGPTQIGVILAAGILLFFLETGVRDPSVAWFARGSARSGAILGGELWRTVTALTLHADLIHAVGNAIACLLFVGALGRALGPGVTALLLLLAGAAGNALTAGVRGPGYDSVGASTAVFAAVGALASLAVARRRRVPRARRWRDFAPFAAGLGILAMLGTGEESDVWAHFLGLVSGAALGAAAAVLPRPPGGRTQAALCAFAAAALLAAWARALAGGGA